MDLNYKSNNILLHFVYLWVTADFGDFGLNFPLIKTLIKFLLLSPLFLLLSYPLLALFSYHL